MHEIIFYEDNKGNKPVLEYIRQLASTNGKDSRIKLKKIQEYIDNGKSRRQCDSIA